MKNRRTFKKNVLLILRGYGVLLRLYPQYMAWSSFCTVVSLVSPYFTLYMSSLVINQLAYTRNVKTLLLLAAVTVGGMLLLSVLIRLAQAKEETYRSVIWNRNVGYMLNAQNSMQYAHLENPDVVLLREKISAVEMATGRGLTCLVWRVKEIIYGIGNVALSVTLAVSMFAMKGPAVHTGFLGFVNSDWATAAVAASLLLNAAVHIVTNNAETYKVSAAWEELGKFNTKYFALNALQGHDCHIFELRRIILREHAKQSKMPFMHKAKRIQLLYGSLRLVWDHAMMCLLSVFVAAKAFAGAFGIGNFVLYRGAAERFIQGVSALATAFGDLMQNNDALEDVFRFIDMPNDMYAGSLSVEKRDDIEYEIEFRDVSFRYPRSEAWALRHVSFKFNIGERMAVVGMNGSGKTTFIKLLCRLYEPTEGRILLNGIDISKYKQDEYMKIFSVVFQDFSLFSFSIGQNVAAGQAFDAQKVTACLEKAGLGPRIAQLERGIDTPLRRDYEDDGIDVSGGEAQKIAIARALYKEAPFIILDEPTAALDPIAEAEIYDHFNRIVENKTAIFISHRLSSCRFCNRIAVFENGSIVQQGDHDSLVADVDGMYYRLWNAQAKYYS